MNISTGSASLVEQLSRSCGSSLLDVHSDIDHNRSVFTLYGTTILEDLKSLCAESLRCIDIESHTGVHPRFGAVDVVPFVPYELGQDALPLALSEAIRYRDEFARFAAEEFGVNAYVYGPERSLPETRRSIRDGVPPSFGAKRYDIRRGSMCIGARNPLVAYNLIVEASLQEAKRIARDLRNERVRTLVFEVKEGVQISANLVEPWIVGPIPFYEKVEAMTIIKSAELVGLIPGYCLLATERPLETFGLAPASTIEARVEKSLRNRME